MTLVTASKKLIKFDLKRFVSNINGGRKIEAFAKKQTIFAQGDSSDAVFFIKDGKVKLTVVSEIGKEATIGILKESDFFGEGCLTGQPLHLCSATAMTDYSVMKIDKKSCASSGARVFRYVRGVSAGTKYTVRIGFG